MPITQQEIEAMTKEEKLALIIRLKETLEEEEYVDDEDEETEEELSILNERLQEYIANPSIAIPWKEALRKLRIRNENA